MNELETNLIKQLEINLEPFKKKFTPTIDNPF